MFKSTLKIASVLLLGWILTGCVVAKTTGKVAALPFKAAYKTTEITGKTIYGTGKFMGKSAFAVGKGVYYVGSVPVKITDKALDTTSKVLSVTTQAVNLGGKVITTTRYIQAAELEGELAALRGATNILSVLIDAV